MTKFGSLCIALIASLSSMAFSQKMPSSALVFLDPDGDSLVTQQEIVQQMDLFFAPMDTNKNGQLDFDEVSSFLSREIFDSTDANGNGAVSKAEYREQVLKDFVSADVDSNGVLD